MSTSPDSTARIAAELAVDVDTASVADANDLRDAAGLEAVFDEGVWRTELPLEADPADVVEQDADVPYDDEER